MFKSKKQTFWVSSFQGFFQRLTRASCCTCYIKYWWRCNTLRFYKISEPGSTQILDSLCEDVITVSTHIFITATIKLACTWAVILLVLCPWTSIIASETGLLKLTHNYKWPQISKTILRKNKVGNITHFYFRIYCKMRMMINSIIFVN